MMDVWQADYTCIDHLGVSCTGLALWAEQTRTNSTSYHSILNITRYSRASQGTVCVYQLTFDKQRHRERLC